MRLPALAFALILALFSGAATAPAQDAPNKTPAPQAAAPAAGGDASQKKSPEQAARKTPVTVEHDDTDPVGARLAYHVRELLARSALMAPSNKDEKKLVIVLKTREEFPGRQGLCSIYSISWLFSAREGSLKYFLTAEAGIVDATSLDQTAEAILAKTDKLATTYGYLF